MSKADEFIETPRLTLRHWQVRDADDLYRYASDPIVGPRAGWPPHQSVEESKEIIRTIFSGEGMWAIVWKPTSEVIGCVGYLPNTCSNLNIAETEVEVGYWVGRPFWNKGIATEALQAIVDYCFTIQHHTALWGGHFEDNPSSGRVMEKCGFTERGSVSNCANLEVGNDKPVRTLCLENPQYK